MLVRRQRRRHLDTGQHPGGAHPTIPRINSARQTQTGRRATQQTAARAATLGCHGSPCTHRPRPVALYARPEQGLGRAPPGRQGHRAPRRLAGIQHRTARHGLDFVLGGARCIAHQHECAPTSGECGSAVSTKGCSTAGRALSAASANPGSPAATDDRPGRLPRQRQTAKAGAGQVAAREASTTAKGYCSHGIHGHGQGTATTKPPPRASRDHGQGHQRRRHQWSSAPMVIGTSATDRHQHHDCH